MKLIVVSHPFGGDHHNLDLATEWTAWLNEHLDALFVAPWIPLCKHWPNSGAHYYQGIDLSCEAIQLSDGLIMVGGSMGTGGALEHNFATSRGIEAEDFVGALTPDHLTPNDIARMEKVYGKRTLG